MSRVCVVLCVCVCIYRDEEQYVCVYTCVYVSTYTHTYTHTNTHTHTQENWRKSVRSPQKRCVSTRGVEGEQGVRREAERGGEGGGVPPGAASQVCCKPRDRARSTESGFTSAWWAD
jgi:hypothetical protein